MSESSIEIRHRPATPAERELLESGQGIPIRGRRFVIVPLTLLAVLIVGGVMLVASLALPPEQWAFGFYAGVGLAGIVTGLLVRAVRREADRVRQNMDDDLTGDQICVVSVTDAEWFHYGGVRTFSKDGYSQEFPMLIADCGAGDRLLLAGETLLNPAIFGREDHEVDFVANDHSLNGLPIPDGFPTASFELEHWPRTAIVVSIRPNGPPVLPRRVTVQSLNRIGWEMQPVMTFQGDPGLTDLETGEPVTLSTADVAT